MTCRRGLPGVDASGVEAEFGPVALYRGPDRRRRGRCGSASPLSAERQPGRQPEKFAYKLDWFGRLARPMRGTCSGSLRSRWRYAATITSSRRPKTPRTRPPGSATPCSSRRASAAFRALTLSRLCRTPGELGKQPPGTFTFWDYQAGRVAAGPRHPHRLCTCCRPRPPTASVGVETHRDARDMEKPSDHVPVVVEIEN